jgi:hypothetical protein
MSEQEVTRSLRLIRYGGVVVTITVLIVLIGFAAVIGAQLPDTGGPSLLNQLIGYIVGLTVLTAILATALYFGYRARLMGMVKK